MSCQRSTTVPTPKGSGVCTRMKAAFKRLRNRIIQNVAPNEVCQAYMHHRCTYVDRSCIHVLRWKPMRNPLWGKQKGSLCCPLMTHSSPVALAVQLEITTYLSHRRKVKDLLFLLLRCVPIIPHQLRALIDSVRFQAITNLFMPFPTMFMMQRRKY